MPNAGERRQDPPAIQIALVAGVVGGLSEAIERNNLARDRSMAASTGFGQRRCAMTPDRDPAAKSAPQPATGRGCHRKGRRWHRAQGPSPSSARGQQATCGHPSPLRLRTQCRRVLRRGRGRRAARDHGGRTAVWRRRVARRARHHGASARPRRASDTPARVRRKDWSSSCTCSTAPSPNSCGASVTARCSHRSQKRAIKTNPAIIRTQPTMRPRPAACSVKPTQPKWSSTTEQTS